MALEVPDRVQQVPTQDVRFVGSPRSGNLLAGQIVFAGLIDHVQGEGLVFCEQLLGLLHARNRRQLFGGRHHLLQRQIVQRFAFRQAPVAGDKSLAACATSTGNVLQKLADRHPVAAALRLPAKAPRIHVVHKFCGSRIGRFDFVRQKLGPVHHGSPFP
jgi:hypothetical protein